MGCYKRIVEKKLERSSNLHPVYEIITDRAIMVNITRELMLVTYSRSLVPFSYIPNGAAFGNSN